MQAVGVESSSTRKDVRELVLEDLQQLFPPCDTGVVQAARLLQRKLKRLYMGHVAWCCPGGDHGLQLVAFALMHRTAMQSQQSSRDQSSIPRLPSWVLVFFLYWDATFPTLLPEPSWRKQLARRLFV